MDERIKTMSKLLKNGLIICSLIGFQTSYGQATNAEVEQLKTSLKQSFPELTVENISPSPISNLYQVTAGAAIVYVTKDGRYLISGDIIDLKDQQKNITERARKQARLSGINAIGKDNMIVFSPKDPKYTITVFTDIDCGYCRKLQSEIPELNAKGIAVQYLAFPRTGPNTPTFEKMVKIWCAKDKTKAIADPTQSLDKFPTIPGCSDQTVLKQMQLGLMMGVAGTPTIIFEDGTMLPGYLPPDKLAEAVKEAQVQAKKDK